MGVAAITGGTGALGHGVAGALAAAGHDVVVTTEHDPSSWTGPGRADVVDLRDLEATRAWARGLGTVSAAVLCAGGFAMKPLAESSAAELAAMIDVNLRTAAHALAALGPVMAPGSGVVVVGSATFEGHPGAAIYGASKAGVVSLARALAAEWKPRGVRVNAILPDMIDTPANRKAMPNADFDKWAKPAEIGAVVAWLCSDAARVVNGNVVKVGR
jgi:NAD(P)-dependent dehydrogenase (short-subunit alcohol dehydrogenase family)